MIDHTYLFGRGQGRSWCSCICKGCCCPDPRYCVPLASYRFNEADWPPALGRLRQTRLDDCLRQMCLQSEQDQAKSRIFVVSYNFLSCFWKYNLRVVVISPWRTFKSGVTVSSGCSCLSQARDTKLTVELYSSSHLLNSHLYRVQVCITLVYGQAHQFSICNIWILSNL